MIADAATPKGRYVLTPCSYERERVDVAAFHSLTLVATQKNSRIDSLVQMPSPYHTAGCGLSALSAWRAAKAKQNTASVSAILTGEVTVASSCSSVAKTERKSC